MALPEWKIAELRFLSKSLSFVKRFKDEGQWQMSPFRMTCMNNLDGKQGDANFAGPSNSFNPIVVQPVDLKARPSIRRKCLFSNLVTRGTIP